MNKRTMQRQIVMLLALAVPIVIAGCGRDKGTTAPAVTYTITATNVSNNQPLSPLAVVVHTDGYTAWRTGVPASSGLEHLAEGGDPAQFIDEAKAAGSRATATGGGPIAPGAAATITLSTVSSSDLRLTTATMLVNTNDGFTGAVGAIIGDLGIGDSRTVPVFVYDAGTEANEETAATIPGPAGNGEGYNSVRETRNVIALHSGVVTHDDGLAASALDESHRFQAPVMTIVVTRTK